MDSTVVLLLLLSIVGPAVVFVLKLCLFTVAAAVVANAISPTVVVKEERRHDQD